MRWDEIDFDQAIWTIPREKFKTDILHFVPLVPSVVDILTERKNANDANSDWVFPSEVTDLHIVDPKRQWRNICKKAEITNLRIHDLRRTLGSWMAMTGASMLIIAGALGHKLDTSSVTGVYARLDIEPIRKAMETAVDAMLKAGGVIRSGEVIEFKQVVEKE